MWGWISDQFFEMNKKNIFNLKSPSHQFIFLFNELICYTFQAQSVIQANQQSVIQTATNLQPMTLSKSVLLKPNSVIHTAQGSLQAVHVSL